MATASQTQSLDAGPTGSGANGGQSSWAAKLRGPGFYRAAWMMALGVAFAFFLTWVIRASTGHATFRHYISGEAILTVSMLAVPLLFLAVIIISALFGGIVARLYSEPLNRLIRSRWRSTLQIRPSTFQPAAELASP